MLAPYYSNAHETTGATEVVVVVVTGLEVVVVVLVVVGRTVDFEVDVVETAVVELQVKKYGLSLYSTQTFPATQHVAPVQPTPPHW
jgi:hypothetical protein